MAKIPNEPLYTLPEIPAQLGLTQDMVFRYEKTYGAQYGIRLHSIKMPGRCGKRLTCDTWVREFLVDMDKLARRLAATSRRGRVPMRSRRGALEVA